ncbi:hypothetical protein N7517_011047 [Penicillium concentricum]|uniref:Rhodopsin domain-containing protein n=1 Tax=Penicillium concentricum TaxID=293559 RepID=A0A9W9UT02_9EURO|nr:uncharacterized protein N7517_011047 [Penicillium concentricum]KAJ5356438.1 hypothetical protein N7517_011047 [Penicillium concentricum]
MGASWVPDQQRPYSGGPLVGAIIAITILQIVFVAARFYTRFMQRAKIGADDYLILLALVPQRTMRLIYHAVTKVDIVGYHYDYVSQMPEKFALMRKCFFAIEVLDYPFNITLVKLALLLFYLRIFTTCKFQILIYIVGALVLAVGVADLLEIFLQCRPLAYGWDQSIPGEKCIHPVTAYQTLVPLNIFTGLLILVMPMPTLWKLHIPLGQRLAVTGVFLLGGLGNVASILQMAIYLSASDFSMSDPTWFVAKFGVLSILEGGLIIIAACIISIWPLYTQVMPRRFPRSLSRYMPRRRQHWYWYLRETTTKNGSQEGIAPSKEVRSSSSPSLQPSSLADMEDQRWSILVDDEVGSSYQSIAASRR